MTLAEIRAHELERTAYHEAGHVVVARAYGLSATAVVWTNLGITDVMEMKTAGGKAFYEGSLHRDHIALVGLAGTVANLLMDNPAIHARDVLDYLEVEPVSETDREQIGAVREADVERCLALLRDLWPDVQREAAELVALAEELEG